MHLVIRVSMLSYSCLISQIKHESHEIRSSLIYMYSYLPAVTLHFSDIFYTQIVIKFLDKSNNILNVSFDNSGLTLYIHIYYICILSWFGFFWQWSKCEKIVTVCVCVCVLFLFCLHCVYLFTQTCHRLCKMWINNLKPFNSILPLSDCLTTH